MPSHSRKSDWPIVAGVVVVVLAVTLGLYIGGYFALSGTVAYPFNNGRYYRVFEHEWQATIYRPVTRVESTISGLKVGACWGSTDDFYEFDPTSADP
jgi:hypothetical protein